MITPFMILKQKEKERQKLISWRERKSTVFSHSIQRKKSLSKKSMIISTHLKNNKTEIIPQLEKKKQDSIEYILKKITTANRYKSPKIPSPTKSEPKKLITWRNFNPYKTTSKQMNKNPQRLKLTISGQKQKLMKKQMRCEKAGKSKKQKKIDRIDIKELQTQGQIRQIKGIISSTVKQKAEKRSNNTPQLESNRGKYYLYETLATKRNYGVIPNQHKSRVYKIVNKTHSVNLNQEIDKMQNSSNLHLKGWDIHEEQLGTSDLH